MFSEDSYLRGRAQSGAHELLSDPGGESITKKPRGKPGSVAIKLMTLHSLVLYNLRLPVDSASHLLNMYSKQEHFTLWKGKSIGKQFRSLKKCSVSRHSPRLAFTSILKTILIFKETLYSLVDNSFYIKCERTQKYQIWKIIQKLSIQFLSERNYVLILKSLYHLIML